MDSKYDPNIASELLKWMSEVMNEKINTDGDKGSFYETLRDGQVLCR